MALQEQFGGTSGEQVSAILDRLDDANTSQERMLTILGIAQDYATLLSQDLAAAYQDSEDPDIGLTVWDTAWSRVEQTLSEHFFDHKLQVLTDINGVIRDTVPGIDPLSFPFDHPDPSVATFYQRFEKNLPKPISSDTHIGRPAQWSY